MSMQGNNNNKMMIYGLAGAGALIAGALAFHYFSSKTVSSSACFDEIEALGPAKREANGMLAFNYYKDIFMIISKHSKQKFAEEKKELLIRRRKALKEKNDDEYKEIVKDMIQREEAAFADLLGEAMEHIGLSEQDFMQMHQYYMSNPQTQQVLMQAQLMPAQAEGAQPKLTKQKTKEIFLYSEEKKMESMKKMMTNPQRYSQDPMEGMMDMMIEQAKLSDEMYEKYGTEEDDFNAAMVSYNLMHDPEINSVIMNNMKKLGMGGGMGGMMGM